MKIITAKLIEQGNGFPEEGSYVADHDGDLYKVTKVDSSIHVDTPRGNYIWGELERANWDDCLECDVFPVKALPIVALACP